MCIIIYKPAGTTITKNTLRNCWENNSDGGGFMYAAVGQLVIYKGFDSFRKMYKAFRAHENYFSGKDFVLHFRIATSGLKDKDNCHPIKINENLAYVHNGILSGFTHMEAKRSDTFLFGNKILSKLDKNFIKSSATIKLLETYAKSEQSKFVFMNNKGDYLIVNQQGGYWEDGIWYSNYGYKWRNQTFGFSYCGYNNNVSMSMCAGCGAYFDIMELDICMDNYCYCSDCQESLQKRLKYPKNSLTKT